MWMSTECAFTKMAEGKHKYTPYHHYHYLIICIYVSAAPSNDELLTDKDAITVYEELLPAQNKSYELGLKLKLPEYVVEGIQKSFSDPQTRLLHVLKEFRNQMEPRPTWRIIVGALRSPAVNLPQLASEVEATHFPESVKTKVPKTSGRNCLLSLTHTHMHTQFHTFTSSLSII